MRLSTVGLAASRFTLALAVILLFSSNTFAQHSGGGSSASAGSSGGGGSHGGSSGGGSATSGGGHSSGGSSSHSSGGSVSHSSGGSSSHSSSAHTSSSGSASSRSNTSHPGTPHSNTASNNLHSVHAPSTGARGQAQPPQKHGFFSFLRHHVPMPLPKPEPKPAPKEPVAKVRPPLCFRGPCPVCPVGHLHGGSGCGGTFIRERIRRVCMAGESWINGACLQQSWYQDQCAGLRVMMERQAERMHAAQLDRQITCSIGPWQQCSDLTSSAESEAGFYQQLQNRYLACQRRSPVPLPHNGLFPGYSTGLSFNSLSFELDHHLEDHH